MKLEHRLQHESQQRQIDELEGRLNDLRIVLGRLHADRDRQQAQVAALELILTIVRDTADSLKNNNSALTQQVTDLQLRLEKVEAARPVTWVRTCHAHPDRKAARCIAYNCGHCGGMISPVGFCEDCAKAPLSERVKIASDFVASNPTMHVCPAAPDAEPLKFLETPEPPENNNLHHRYYGPVTDRNLHLVCPNCGMTYWNGYPHTCPTTKLRLRGASPWRS